MSFVEDMLSAAGSAAGEDVDVLPEAPEEESEAESEAEEEHPWATLDHKEEWTKLGWNEEMWDGNGAAGVPATEGVPFETLSEEEQAAALAIGYTAEEWNDEEPVVPGVKAVKKRAVKKQAKGFFACC
jgi:hypothetical protein